ncbi:PPA1309 family protein [Nocardioides mangrovicus]|uniref:PPA1309 family protein n=1 Tax=Nocardioides mangrovicus TaxID=2478913 RepID=UPI0018E06950|nr:PPA1309 family protein [Nocardioides mangrovicus]
MLNQLEAVVREIEAHAAESGWDRGAGLYALVPTAELAAAEPALAAQLGLSADAAGFTPIDQELPADRDLEDELSRMSWPEEVAGCAAVVERLVLPPSAEAEIPEEPGAAQTFAAQHPERQELRLVAAALRDGTTCCAMRFRSHDEAASVVVGPDLVPTLLELLQTTLAGSVESEHSADPDREESQQ